MDHELTIHLPTETIRRIADSQESASDISAIHEAVKRSVESSFLIVDPKQWDLDLSK